MRRNAMPLFAADSSRAGTRSSASLPEEDSHRQEDGAYFSGSKSLSPGMGSVLAETSGLCLPAK